MQTPRNKQNYILATILLSIFLFAIPAQAETAKIAETPEPFALFEEVFNHTLEKYYQELDPKQLEEKAIQGMLQELDPYSDYYDKDKYERFKVEMEGRIGGVGLRIEKVGEFITVAAPLPNTPGEKAGILAGDIILKADEKELKGLTVEEATDFIRGEPGTEVKLTIHREGIQKPLSFAITRDIIELQVVESEILEGDIGYIKVNSFTNSSTDLYRTALTNLRLEGVKGVILDLRNNPGGYLGPSLSVVTPFIEKDGELVHIESRTEGDNTYYSASKGIGLPLVVLVNKGSASGSEIVAGAIQDHKAGTIVGTTTFGKATVQHLYKLSNGGAIKVTTAVSALDRKSVV